MVYFRCGLSYIGAAALLAALPLALLFLPACLPDLAGSAGELLPLKGEEEEEEFADWG